jgi:hypothetical protein
MTLALLAHMTNIEATNKPTSRPNTLPNPSFKVTGNNNSISKDFVPTEQQTKPSSFKQQYNQEYRKLHNPVKNVGTPSLKKSFFEKITRVPHKIEAAYKTIKNRLIKK